MFFNFFNYPIFSLPHLSDKMSPYFVIFDAMKFFGIIMSFYLLALSCFPCNDRQESNVKAEQKISTTTQQQQHQAGDEACTPFCTCSCCPASAFYQPFPYFSVYKAVFQSVKYPIYTSSFCSEVSSSIWQPPKIA